MCGINEMTMYTLYLLNLMGDLVDIDATVVCLLLVVTISAL